MFAPHRKVNYWYFVRGPRESSVDVGTLRRCRVMGEKREQILNRKPKDAPPLSPHGMFLVDEYIE